MTTSTTRDHAEHITSFIKTIADKSCDEKLTGIAIGVIFAGQELSAVSGWADVESKKPVSDSTIFELGSLSKLFTSLLLAVATTKQEVRLDDPVQTALGEAVTLPTDGTSQITYRSLANHRSSLPRLPDDLIATADMENPYVHYDQEMLYACLNRMEPVKRIGSRSSYSNFGVGLLGHVLGQLAGTDYRKALKERVLIPLAMRDTSTESCDEQTAKLAIAHKKKDKVTKHWDFTEVTVAAGGVRSSLSDMFKFLRANIYPKTSELADEIVMMGQPSELPQSESNPGKYTDSFMPVVYAITFVLAISSMFAFFFMGTQWILGVELGGFLSHFMIIAPTFGAAFLWGRIPGAVALVLTTLLTWWLWGASFDLASNLIMGTALIYVGSTWKPLWAAMRAGGGEGRLAWQSSAVGSHPMLWHNGMVGGSASYLGIVQEFEIGVVVLTNTARSVDTIGLKVLSELVKLKKKALREQNSD